MPAILARTLPVLMLGTLLAVPPAPPAAGSTIAAVEPGFEWSMPDRFGIDADRDGLVDMPNRTAYVHGTVDLRCEPECPTPSFAVAFEARLGSEVLPVDFPMVEYQWSIDPEAGPS